MMTLRTAAVTAAILLHLPVGATDFMGNTTGGARFNRPVAGAPPTMLSASGTAVPFEVTAFTVTAGGLYDFNLASAYDNYLGLYAGSFNPAAPLVNALRYDDDSGPGSNAFFNFSLNPGTSYFAVASGFSNTDFGQYTLAITGPGTAQRLMTPGVFAGNTADAPVFNRPTTGAPPTTLSGVGTAVRYQVTAFSVTAIGRYEFINTSAYDNFLGLYSGSFNPAAPLANALRYDDDSGPGSNAFFNFGLTTGTDYFAVATGFANTDFGPYSLAISGPGTIVLAGSAIPEPAVWALLMAGFGLVGARLRHHRAATGLT